MLLEYEIRENYVIPFPVSSHNLWFDEASLTGSMTGTVNLFIYMCLFVIHTFCGLPTHYTARNLCNEVHEVRILLDFKKICFGYRTVHVAHAYPHVKKIQRCTNSFFLLFPWKINLNINGMGLHPTPYLIKPSYNWVLVV